ncbi:MAG: hypothetical protein RBS57_11360 [Desulforhabdus sp.]|jgi:cytochrome c556|nr:hypothetical protein [Desulforhabdus sp.]
MLKRFGWIVAIVLVTMVAACAPKTENKAVTSKDVIEQTQKAMDTLQAFLQEQKGMHANSAEAKLQRLDRRIAMLQASSAKMESEAKARLEKQIEAFKSKEEAFKQKLGKTMAAGDQDWEKLVAEIAAGLNDLENEFDKVLETL